MIAVYTTVRRAVLRALAGKKTKIGWLQRRLEGILPPVERSVCPFCGRRMKVYALVNHVKLSHPREVEELVERVLCAKEQSRG